MKYIKQDDLIYLMNKKYSKSFNKLNQIKNKVLNALKQGNSVNTSTGWSEVKEVLKNEYGDSCWLCEAKFGSSYYGDIEHYRPKNKVLESPNHNGYEWLAHDITNYLLSCKLCNSNYQNFGKGTSFKLLNEQDRAMNYNDDITKEEPKLLLPYNESDIKLLSFDHLTGKVNNIYLKGSKNYKKVKYTSELILNRDSGLVVDRKEELELFEGLILLYQENPSESHKAIIKKKLNSEFYLAKYLLLKEMNRDLFDDLNLKFHTDSKFIIEEKKEDFIKFMKHFGINNSTIKIIMKYKEF